MNLSKKMVSTRLLAFALLPAFVCACAQIPISSAHPDFSPGYEDGRVAARKDAAEYRCFRKNRRYEGSIHLMKYSDMLAKEQRSDAYIQGFRMGFRRFFNYYVEIHCPDFTMLP